MPGQRRSQCSLTICDLYDLKPKGGEEIDQDRSILCMVIGDQDGPSGITVAQDAIG